MPKSKIAIIGANRPRLYWTFCAAQALGAVPVPVYSDSVAEEMGQNGRRLAEKEKNWTTEFITLSNFYNKLK